MKGKELNEEYKKDVINIAKKAFKLSVILKKNKNPIKKNSAVGIIIDELKTNNFSINEICDLINTNIGYENKISSDIIDHLVEDNLNIPKIKEIVFLD
jgi:hypothetical protein